MLSQKKNTKTPSHRSKTLITPEQDLLSFLGLIFHSTMLRAIVIILVLGRSYISIVVSYPCGRLAVPSSTSLFVACLSFGDLFSGFHFFGWSLVAIAQTKPNEPLAAYGCDEDDGRWRVVVVLVTPF